MRTTTLFVSRVQIIYRTYMTQNRLPPHVSQHHAKDASDPVAAIFFQKTSYLSGSTHGTLWDDNHPCVCWSWPKCPDAITVKYVRTSMRCCEQRRQSLFQIARTKQSNAYSVHNLGDSNATNNDELTWCFCGAYGSHVSKLLLIIIWPTMVVCSSDGSKMECKSLDRRSFDNSEILDAVVDAVDAVVLLVLSG